MPILKPVADLEAGLWKPSSGTSLYAMLNEPTRDDTTYIYSAKTAPNLVQVALRAGSDAVFNDGTTNNVSVTIPSTTLGGDEIFWAVFARSDITSPGSEWKLFLEKREYLSSVLQWFQLYHKTASGTVGAASPDAGTTLTISQASALRMGAEVVVLHASGQPVIAEKAVVKVVAEANFPAANTHPVQALTTPGPSRFALAISMCVAAPSTAERAYYDNATTRLWANIGPDLRFDHRLSIGHRTPADAEVLGGTFFHDTAPHTGIETSLIFTNDQGGRLALPLGLRVLYRCDDGVNGQGSSDRVSDYSNQGRHITRGSAAGADTNDPAWAAAGGLDFTVDDYSFLPASVVTAWAPATADYTLVMLAKWGTLAADLPLVNANSATAQPGTLQNSSTALQGVVGNTTLTGGTLTAGAWCVPYMRRGGANGDIGINAAAVASSAAVANGTNPTEMVLGGNPTSARYLEGSIGAFLLFNRALTDAEITDVYSYIKTNYATPRGITLP